jgi:hypothetical protein
MPDDTCSLVVFAVVCSLDNAEDACIVGPNCAITIVCVASLPGIQDSCEYHGEVNKDGEGKESHLDRIMSVGLLGLM